MVIIFGTEYLIVSSLFRAHQVPSEFLDFIVSWSHFFKLTFSHFRCFEAFRFWLLWLFQTLYSLWVLLSVRSINTHLFQGRVCNLVTITTFRQCLLYFLRNQLIEILLQICFYSCHKEAYPSCNNNRFFPLLSKGKILTFTKNQSSIIFLHFLCSNFISVLKSLKLEECSR